MRVLVADDHSLFRDGMISLLEAAGFEVVGQAGNGLEAVQGVRQLHPDLVLLDLSMPQMGGLEALRLIKAESPQTRVVVLTVSTEDSDLFAAIRSGANGYLLKNLTATEFLEMLDGLERGEAAITRKTTTRLLASYTHQPEAASPEIHLTARELELLQWVAEGLSNKSIAQLLSVSNNTVKYHMRNILQKMNVQNRTEAVTHAMRAGLLPAPGMETRQAR